MKKILIIDDNLTTIHFIRNVLEKNFICDVKELSESINAVDIISDYNPHLVILDVIMPYMDGLELSNILHSLQCKPAIVIITSLSQITNKLLLNEYKEKNIIDDYIFKPFSEKELCNKLISIIED